MAKKATAKTKDAPAYEGAKPEYPQVYDETMRREGGLPRGGFPNAQLIKPRAKYRPGGK